MKTALLVLALLIVLATALPLFRHEDWWIRVFDFPRLQVAASGLAVLVAYTVMVRPKSTVDIIVIVALVVAIGRQCYEIYFYTPLAPKQVRDSNQHAPERTLSLMVANVLMENREAQRFLEVVRDAGPDVLLTLEPDAWWEERLQILENDYPFTVKRPLENRYGMILYSKLQLVDSQIKEVATRGVPSIHTQLRLKSGDLIRLHCVHPAPPSPTEAESSEPRDAELLIIGEQAKDSEQPVIVGGDLNDVAWSYTTTLFQKTSGLLDPRAGRGLLNTYHAKIPLLRWPLDHVFHSKEFMLVDIARLPPFGSDHFAIQVKLSLEPLGQHLQEDPEALDAEEKRLVEEKISNVDERGSGNL